MAESSLTIILIKFAVSALVIIIAGVFLTRFADRISDLTGLGKAVVGSLFLAGATSLPELFIDINAVMSGEPDLAVGDLMGSSLFNLLILAIGDMVHRGKSVVFSKASGKSALAGSMSIALTALASLAILQSSQTSPYAIGTFGVGSLALILFYLLGARMVYRDQRTQSAGDEISGPQHRKKSELIKAFAGYGVCTLALFVSAPFLARSAARIAEITGLGTTFIGTTLVAFCTSLPELVATLTSVRIGAIDMAVGNIFGSNAFNMILIAPLDFVHKGPILASVTPHHAFTGLMVIFITSIAVMGQLYQVENRRRFLEPDALAIMVLVFASLFALYGLSTH